MAELVNMQQTEYEEVLSRLITLHQEETESIKNIQTMISNLCEKEGGFYVEQITVKMNMMLSGVETYILEVLKENFETSETAMETFMASIKATDRR